MMRVAILSVNESLIAGFRTTMPPVTFFSCNPLAELEVRRLAETVDALIIDSTCDAPLRVLQQLRGAKAGIIIWGHRLFPALLSEAFRPGARGVLYSNSTPEACMDCISHIAAGERWIESRLYHAVLRARTTHLTTRESEVMELLAQGFRHKEIANRLNLTEGTVKIYISRLFRKLGMSDRLELALFALKHKTAELQRVPAEQCFAGFYQEVPLFSISSPVSCIPCSSSLR